MFNFVCFRYVYSVFFTVLLFACNNEQVAETWQWQTLETQGQPTARHEAGLVAIGENLFLLGGRRINPTDVYNTQTNAWTAKSPTPIELHHFQPVVWQDEIYIVGAMTGQWPNEIPVAHVIKYNPKSDTYSELTTIPESRRRGGAGAVVYNNKIYLVGGITKGHMHGYVPWLDVYDPATGEWQVLDDGPNARDHFQAVVLNDKLYAFAGRTSSRITKEDMALTLEYGNVYDLQTQRWLPVNSLLAIPTQRAGNSAFIWQDEVVIGGGESVVQLSAHNEVEAYNPLSQTWRTWPAFNRGRHGTGIVVVGDYAYTASGCGNRGGEPELVSLERIKLPANKSQASKPVLSNTAQNSTGAVPVYSQWHNVAIDITGPSVSELDEDNPFLNYRLDVVFKHGPKTYQVRGFYAADGNAAQTSADSGNVWRGLFTPDELGEWQYEAVLYSGPNIALGSDTSDKVISQKSGKFVVIKSDKELPDFRALGRLGIENGYFKFSDVDKYWLKGGTNSPENLLGYVDFDGTYRIAAQARDGEAQATTELHQYPLHAKDWSLGDPVWQLNKGKNIIGGINYLASKGINSAYFLTMNILGDGKDVWPYESPEDFGRFDVSKLAQWDIVFSHMQQKGMLLHMVLQETENELMLDGGDTGPQRQLYFNEMIARFAHHPALVWNLGEENGPASWSPKAQNDRQRKDMTTFLKKSDPYQHPVLLHTHANDPERSDILTPILGFSELDGLSLQQAERKEVNQVIRYWKHKAEEAGKSWLITMDEIGEWQNGAVPDSVDGSHDSLRRHVLWGTLMAGGAGVEWYFGAKHPHNDLTSEDWRQREQLWQQTSVAVDFYQTYLPYWQMSAMADGLQSSSGYVFAKDDELIVLYVIADAPALLALGGIGGEYSVQSFNPIIGGDLVSEKDIQITPGQSLDAQLLGGTRGQDRVFLLRKKH